MSEEAYIVGGIVQFEEPRWEPLERAVGEELMETFMWMFEVQTTEHRRFQAYKHRYTRRYLHVDHQGNAYDFVSEHDGRDRYRQVPLADAIELALRSWWEELDASPDDVADVRGAIERARRRESRSPSDPTDE